MIYPIRCTDIPTVSHSLLLARGFASVRPLTDANTDTDRSRLSVACR